MAEVTLPRWVFFSLVAGLAVSSLAAVFLAGRMTAPVSTASTAGVGGPAAAKPAEGADPLPVPGAAPPGPPLSTDGTPVPEETAPPPPSSQAPPAACPDPTAIQRYLTEMERAVSTGKTWDDPTALAQTIVSDALAGRTEGLDGLVSSSAAVLGRVQAIEPPSACVDCARHHSETQATLQASLRLLGSMRDGIASGNLNALMGAQADAASLEGRAREIESLDDEIRRTCSL